MSFKFDRKHVKKQDFKFTELSVEMVKKENNELIRGMPVHEFNFSSFWSHIFEINGMCVELCMPLWAILVSLYLELSVLCCKYK